MAFQCYHVYIAQKRDSCDCTNYRTLPKISHASKFVLNLVYQYLMETAKRVSANHYGFVIGKSTANATTFDIPVGLRQDCSITYHVQSLHGGNDPN